MVILPTFAYDFSDNIVVFVHAPVTPDDADWAISLRDTRACAPSVKGCLVVAGKAQLTPLQRAQLGDTLSISRYKVAVLSDSEYVHEQVELLRARGHQHRCFGETQITQAFDYLDLKPSLRPLLNQRVERLRSLLEEAHRAAHAEDFAHGGPAGPLRDFAKACGMSPREREVVFRLLSGDSRAQVASELGVSEGSIHTYVARACAKAGAASEGDLLRAIIRFLAQNLNNRSLETAS